MTCVVYANGWYLAVLHGKTKELLPECYASVRAACRESARRNGLSEAVRTPRTGEGVAA